MPIVLIFREMLDYAKTTREVKQILQTKNVLVDGTRQKNHRFNVGLMDVISIPEIKENFRISLNVNGRLSLIKIDEKEATTKIAKIEGKSMHKGKIQLQLLGGRTIIIDKGSYKTSDSLVISVPDQKIKEHLKFEKGASILLTGGKNIGVIGTLEDIKENTVGIKVKEGKFETLKKYCYVVGKSKPALKIE